MIFLLLFPSLCFVYIVLTLLFIIYSREHEVCEIVHFFFHYFNCIEKCIHCDILVAFFRILNQSITLKCQCKCIFECFSDKQLLQLLELHPQLSQVSFQVYKGIQIIDLSKTIINKCILDVSHSLNIILYEQKSND